MSDFREQLVEQVAQLSAGIEAARDRITGLYAEGHRRDAENAKLQADLITVRSLLSAAQRDVEHLTRLSAQLREERDSARDERDRALTQMAFTKHEGALT